LAHFGSIAADVDVSAVFAGAFRDGWGCNGGRW